VLWLDAHADFNTPSTSPSGNIHGMSLAMLCGEKGLQGIIEDIDRAPLNPGDVVLFGARSVDGGERSLLAARGLTVIDMRRIDEFGAFAEIRAVIERVTAADGWLHVSLDIDALDPAIAPGVGTSVPRPHFPRGAPGHGDAP
jgi:arginase